MLNDKEFPDFPLSEYIYHVGADIDRYTQKRGFAYDYETTFPGAKVNTFKECIKWLEVYLKNPLEHQELRQKIKNRFHEYSEGGACERIVDLVEKRINNG